MERVEKREETEKTPFEERFQEMVPDLEGLGRIALRSLKREERSGISVSLRFQRRWRYQDEA